MPWGGSSVEDRTDHRQFPRQIVPGTDPPVTPSWHLTLLA